MRVVAGGDDGGVADTSVFSASSLKSCVGSSEDAAGGALGEAGGEHGGDGGGSEVGITTDSLATLAALAASVSSTAEQPSACSTAPSRSRSMEPRGVDRRLLKEAVQAVWLRGKSMTARWPYEPIGRAVMSLGLSRWACHSPCQPSFIFASCRIRWTTFAVSCSPSGTAKTP